MLPASPRTPLDARRLETLAPPVRRQCRPTVRRRERTPGPGRRKRAQANEGRSVPPRPPSVGPGRLSDSIPSPPIRTIRKPRIPVLMRDRGRSRAAAAAVIATPRTGKRHSKGRKSAFTAARDRFTAAQAELPQPTARQGLRPSRCWPNPHVPGQCGSSSYARGRAYITRLLLALLQPRSAATRGSGMGVLCVPGNCCPRGALASHRRRTTSPPMLPLDPSAGRLRLPHDVPSRSAARRRGAPQSWFSTEAALRGTGSGPTRRLLFGA
jgi:hypothetical protein